jgi:hypothetical protein
MTDREIAVATFRAVAALHYAVTGKPLSLSVETEAGTIKIIEGEQPLPTFDPVECSHRQRASPSWLDATLLEPH